MNNKIVTIDNETYDVHKFRVPSRIGKKFKLIKAWFAEEERLQIPTQYKRRYSKHEFAETALSLFSRLICYGKQGMDVSIGSAFLSNKPWAVIGGVGQNTRNFKWFYQFKEFYKELLEGTTFQTELYFRRRSYGTARASTNIYKTLAKDGLVDVNTVMSLSLCLLYDILQNCGPDNEELFDIFSNDLRDDMDTFDLSIWESTRILVFGEFCKNKQANRSNHQPVKKKITKSEVDIELLEGDFSTTPTKIFALNPSTPDPDYSFKNMPAFGLDVDRYPCPTDKNIVPNKISFRDPFEMYYSRGHREALGIDDDDDDRPLFI